MASPETVAQIFPRRPIFDVVVFDEASQCRLEEALPVLVRARRVVIAGDPKQLPPTRFFESALTRSQEDEQDLSEQGLFEDQQADVEDLLGAALNLEIEQCYLDVHYRSQNADLIEFSNSSFYDKRLQPRLSTLVIVVDEDTADLQVTRDGVVLGRAAWRTRIPVDPGTHVVLATAPGKVARRMEIQVGPEGDTQTARIPPLAEAAPAPPPVVAPPPAAAVLPPTPAPVVPVRTGLSTRRSWAVATAGLGVVGVGAGAWLGARAIQKHGDPGSVCTTSPCSATSVSLNDEARAAADGSTVAFAVGAAALAVGAWLWFGDSVSVTASAARLDVTGRF